MYYLYKEAGVQSWRSPSIGLVNFELPHGDLNHQVCLLTCKPKCVYTYFYKYF